MGRYRNGATKVAGHTSIGKSFGLEANGVGTELGTRLWFNRADDPTDFGDYLHQWGASRHDLKEWWQVFAWEQIMAAVLELRMLLEGRVPPGMVRDGATGAVRAIVTRCIGREAHHPECQDKHPSKYRHHRHASITINDPLGDALGWFANTNGAEYTFANACDALGVLDSLELGRYIVEHEMERVAGRRGSGLIERSVFA